MLLVPLLAAVTLSLSDSTGAELNYLPERSATSVDVGTSPTVAVAITSKRSTFDISYGPRLGWVDVTRDGDFVVQHSAGMGYSWGTRRLRLSLGLSGTYGQVSYLSAVAASTPVAMQPVGGDVGGMPQPGQPTQPSQPDQMQATQLLPQVSVLEIGSAGVSLNVNYLLARQWTLGLGIGFGVGGGLRDSQAYLPFRYGPFANVGVGYQFTKRDNLNSGLGASLDILPKARGRFYTVTLLESWSHAFNPLTGSTLGAGLTYVQSKDSAEAEKNRSVNAAGVASFFKGYKLAGGALLGFSTSATLTTAYDPVLGKVAQSLSGGVGAGWSRKRLSLSAGIQGSRSLPLDDPNGFTSYGANAGIGYQLNDAVSLNAGGYWTHQVLPPADVVANVGADRWGVSVGVTVAAPPIEL